MIVSEQRTDQDTVDPRALRTCLGHFATGVTVVTYKDDTGAPRGATVNAFTSVSLDPPLVLVSIARGAAACDLLKERPFCINVLASDQLGIALQFAGKPNSRLELKWATDDVAPHLQDALARMHCAPWRSYDGGDHVLYVGEVKSIHHRDAEPLLFHNGTFRSPGVALFHGPRNLILDGRPVPGWLRTADTLHQHIPTL